MDYTPRRKRVLKQDNSFLLESYPHDLQLYKVPPKGQVTLIEFQDLALERQKVLQLVETTTSNPEIKNIDDYKTALHAALKKDNFHSYAKLIYAPGCSANYDLEARRKDHVSHFILRLSYCQKDDLQNYFVNQETELFKCRFSSLNKEGVNQFLIHSGFDYVPISQDEKDENRENLLQSTAKDVDIDSAFYKMPFEDVIDLVSDRKVYIHKGMAYVPQKELLSVFVVNFRHHLYYELKRAKEFVMRNLNDDRLQSFLKNLPDCYAGMNKVIWTTENTPIEKLNELSKISYPLCMRSLHEILTKDHKLKHGSRMQYGLFLKGINVTLEDSIKFWRSEFTQHPDINDEIFTKKYSYNIRHNYGKEGNQRNYTPMGCQKIINGSVGAGDTHGCPYKHMDRDSLAKKLTEYRISPPDIAEIVKYSTEGMYHLACRKYFEATHKQPPSRPILHPNQYFTESRELITKDVNDQDKNGDIEMIHVSPEKIPQPLKVKVENEAVTPIRSVEKKPKIVDRKTETKNRLNIEALLFEDSD